MKLVIDSNIFLAALLKDSLTRELIFDDRLNLFAPTFSLIEIKKLIHQPRIKKRLHLEEKEIEELINLLTTRIKFIPEKLFLPFTKQAMKLVTHVEDSPFMALALALQIPLWSHDAGLKEQKQIKIYSTKELEEKLT